MTPRPVQQEWGSNWSPVSTRSEASSVLRVRADCGGHLFPAKLGIITHDCMHQVFDHLLPDRAVLTLPPYRFNGPTVFYSSDDPPWCRVRATHRENRYTFRSTFVARPNDPPACPAWGWGRKAVKTQPSSATRVRARDHRASTVLPRASMSAAPAIHSAPQIHLRAVGKLTSVTICRELKHSDQTIKSEHVGTDRRRLDSRSAPNAQCLMRAQ
jgi:hypothetical protein